MGALIPIAIQLAQFAPALMRYFGAGQESSAVAQAAVEVAKTITGATTPEEALAAIKANGIAQLEFQKQIMENDTKLNELYLVDVQDARKRDTAIQVAGHRNYRADAMALGSFGVVLLIAYFTWSRPDVNDYVKGIITLILGRFLGYTDQVFQFEFGAVRRTVIRKEDNGS